MFDFQNINKKLVRSLAKRRKTNTKQMKISVHFKNYYV
ncbi:hypothetical protein FLBR109950_13425 [Flavobacterium branchiophilum]